MTTNRIRHLLESDEDKVVLVTTVVRAAALLERDNTRQAKRLLVRAIRDCLQRLLGREASREEVQQVLRGEM